MKKLFLFGGLLLLFACKKSPISEESLKYLNGYWEISEVVFSDGTKKSYTVNPTVDFIQLDNNKGFRKKMQPKFDGTYKTSGDIHDAELLQVTRTDSDFILRYSNEFSDREEVLTHLDSISFSVMGDDGNLYTYKRFQPIILPK
nr:hypothetical protein [uncultured Allomuricauda sp.]